MTVKLTCLEKKEKKNQVEPNLKIFPSVCSVYFTIDSLYNDATLLSSVVYCTAPAAAPAYPLEKSHLGKSSRLCSAQRQLRPLAEPN